MTISQLMEEIKLRQAATAIPAIAATEKIFTHVPIAKIAGIAVAADTKSALTSVTVAKIAKIAVATPSNTIPVNLIQFVRRCCYGLKTDPQEVLDNLLSIEDEQDIINGTLTLEALWFSINVWLANGKPYYSGKNETGFGSGFRR